jgi:hypothetical protein
MTFDYFFFCEAATKLLGFTAFFSLLYILISFAFNIIISELGTNDLFEIYEKNWKKLVKCWGVFILVGNILTFTLGLPDICIEANKTRILYTITSPKEAEKYKGLMEAWLIKEAGNETKGNEDKGK